ncbi:MAG TPA: hypothetical protein VHF08_06600 [Nitrososphaeraceae archaeon]|nr:hypothetical protein [Nitrososphaeraceae archaeon]
MIINEEKATTETKLQRPQLKVFHSINNTNFTICYAIEVVLNPST